MKKVLIVFLGLIAFSVISSCSNSNAFNSNPEPEPAASNNDHLTMAVLYQQTAAEYRALCYQAFNLARYRLDQSLRVMALMRQQAIIVDIDETILDNSPYEAKCVLEDIIYPEYWDEWVIQANAEPLPGALEFLQYASTKGMKVFYVTNRKEKHRESTLQNLIKFGFPNADDEHLLMQMDESSKKSRREKIAETHSIIMLIGDNLNDFSELFEKKSVEERFQMADKHREDFGNIFIVLPNAMYGEWESALYNYDYSQSPRARSGIRYSKMIGF
jgi:5'-nucleotidase (lipoprotein e(P4) family)